MNISGAEAVVASGSPFIGQGESACLVRPYVDVMTPSEIHLTMTSGTSLPPPPSNSPTTALIIQQRVFNHLGLSPHRLYQSRDPSFNTNHSLGYVHPRLNRHFQIAPPRDRRAHHTWKGHSGQGRR